MGHFGQAYRRFFKLYTRLSDIVSTGSFVACLALLAILTSLAVVAVVFRYILSQPLQWSEEASRYLLVWMVLIGASLALKERQHVNLDFFLVRIGSRAALVVEMGLYTIVVGLTFMVWLFSIGLVANYSFKTYSASLQIRMLWAHAALPVGFLLILIQSIYILLEDARLLIQRQPYPHALDSEKG